MESISISIWQNGTSANGGVAGLEIAPSSPTFFAIAPQPQSTLIALGQNATFTAGAVESPAVANTYQWYEISGGVTNLIAGATANSYTTNSPTVGAGYYVVVGNGSTSLTSSVAQTESLQRWIHQWNLECLQRQLEHSRQLGGECYGWRLWFHGPVCKRSWRDSDSR